jgi:hypothetical protein
MEKKIIFKTKTHKKITQTLAPTLHKYAQKNNISFNDEKGQ